MFVCLSLRSRISNTKCPNFMTFSVHVTCGRGSVLVWQECNTLRTSGFVDDVKFPDNGASGAESKMSLCFVKFTRRRHRGEVAIALFLTSIILFYATNFVVMSATAWTPIWWHLSLCYEIAPCIKEAHDDNFCMRLYTLRPKMSVYQSAFGMTPFFCDSWALVIVYHKTCHMATVYWSYVA